MKHLINNYLEFLSPLIVLLSLIVFYNRWKHLKEMRIFFYYFLSYTIIIGRATRLAITTTPNIGWYTLHKFICLLLLPAFFYNIIHTPALKLQLLWLAVFSIITYIFLFFFWNDYFTFFSPGFALGTIVIVSYCNIYLVHFFFTDTRSPKLPIVFWIVCSLLFYHIAPVLIHSSFKYLTKLQIQHRQSRQFLKASTLWGIQNITLFICCLLISF